MQLTKAQARHTQHILIGLIIVYAASNLLIAFGSNLYSYVRYRSVPKDSGYTNANLRSITNESRWLWLVGSCYEKVSYDFAFEGIIYQGGEQLSCRVRKKLVLGNSIPVYFSKATPAKSVSGFSKSSTIADTLTDGALGIISLVGLGLAWLLMRKYHNQHKHPVLVDEVE